MSVGPAESASSATQIIQECFRIEAEEQHLVENRTPYDIEIANGGDRLLLPALAARKMSGHRLKVFEHELVAFRQLHRLRVTIHRDTSVWTALPGVAVVMALVGLPIVIVVRFLQDGTRRR